MKVQRSRLESFLAVFTFILISPLIINIFLTIIVEQRSPERAGIATIDFLPLRKAES